METTKIKDPIIKGCIELASDILDNFDDAWVAAILRYDSEKEFDKLRKFFDDYKYKIYCDLCNMDTQYWKNKLEQIKTKAFADKKFYEIIRIAHNKKHCASKENNANG